MLTGWSLHHRTPRQRNLCPEQAATQQADLALEPSQRAEAIRLGLENERRHGL